MKGVSSLKIVLIMPGRAQIQLDEKLAKSWLPSGSLLEVAGMTSKDHEVAIYDELSQGSLTPETLPEADFYGLSGLSTSRFGAYRLAKIIHEKGKRVIAGGMDVTGHYDEGHAEELLLNYDSIVVGRLTSRLWARVLADFQQNQLERVYKARPNEPWEYVVPRHDLVIPELYYCPAVIRSSSGCNESCAHCTVHYMLGGRRILQCKSGDLLDEEFAILPDSKYIADASDSWGANYPHTIGVVLPRLRDSGRGWFIEATVKNLLGIGEGRKELITPMGKNGCLFAYIGIESLVGKVGAKSLDVAQVEETIKRLHDVGILVVGSFMMDVTGKETFDSYKYTAEWIIRNKLDFAQFSLVAALVGSDTRRLAIQQGRLIDNNPEHYDGAWPTIEHQMSPKERIEGLRWIYQEVYSPFNIARRTMRLGSIRQMPMVVIANRFIRSSIIDWEVGYHHWEKTRILPG